MKKNSKLLVGLLTIVILAVIGLSAYAYQKQQALNSNKPRVEKKKEDSKLEKFIKDTVSKFDKEGDLNKKIEILKSLLYKKDEVAKESKDKLSTEYNDVVKNMREKIANIVKDKIKNSSLNDEDKKNSEKVEFIKKELNDLQSILEKEKTVLFEKEEDINSISQSIEDVLTSLEAPKVSESTQSQQQKETQSQVNTGGTEAPASQQPANTSIYTPSYRSSSNSNNSNTTYTPTQPTTNSVGTETSGNSSAPAETTAPTAPAETTAPIISENTEKKE